MIEAKPKSPLVKKCELFAGLSHSVYESILSTATPREFLSREEIFREGDPIKETLLLTHGRARVKLLNRYGAEVTLRLVVPGEIIDTLGLTKATVFVSTAQAIEPCRVLAWDITTFEATLERLPDLRRNAIRIVSQHLCELESRFCEISTERVSPRLAHAVIRLIDKIGREVNGHHEINVSQEMLGQMTAMNLATVNRVLSKWEHQGFVGRRRQAIVIRDYKSLSKCLQ